MNHAEETSLLEGVKVCREAPTIPNLLFADDCLIFISAKSQITEMLNDILRIYADCSGQAVNREKSSIYFSPSTSDPVRQRLKVILGISVEAFNERYLGLPTATGRITSGTFEHLRERIRSQLQGGIERMISCAGREVRLKSVAQAIPAFSMSYYKLSKKVYKGITSCMARYWWSSSLDRRSLHWIAWDKLATPKTNGGMGFHDMRIFNLALLGKHGWRFITNPDSLCARVIKGRYFPDGEFLEATVPKTASAIWRAIVAGRRALDVGLIKRVGNGTTISIWNDNWISREHMKRPITSQIPQLQTRVAEHIDHTMSSMDEQLIQSILIPIDAETILKIPLCTRQISDFVLGVRIEGVCSLCIPLTR